MAGEYLAGDEDAGDPFASAEPSEPRARPAALYFDPRTRRHTLEDDGSFTTLHPVDAAVELAMFMVQGRIVASPTTGNALDRTGSPHDIRARRKVEDAVRLALKALVDRGDITIESIDFEVHGAYAKFVGLSYTNMRVQPRKPKPLRVE